LLHIYGTGIEEAGKLFEHLYEPDRAFSVLDGLLLPGGYMIHKIDFRDHGMFSDKHHPYCRIGKRELEQAK
jgi:hypothetical protein